MAQRPLFFEGANWIKPLAIVGLPLFLLLKQPDFGSFAICTIVILSLLFFYGLRWRYIMGALGIMAPSFYFLVMRVPYRHARIMAFLDPWKDPGKGGFQLIQSMLSFHSGRIKGRRFGTKSGQIIFSTRSAHGLYAGNFSGRNRICGRAGRLDVDGLSYLSRFADWFENTKCAGAFDGLGINRRVRIESFNQYRRGHGFATDQRFSPSLFKLRRKALC